MVNSSIVYYKQDGGCIKIDELPISKIREYRQNDPETREAGGVLLGRYILGSTDVVVDDVTVPTPSDCRRRFFFFKNKQSHQAVVTDRWIKSNGTCNYLGEWHTHPEPDPNPSSVDICEWKRLLRVTKFDGDCLYFIIAGTKQIRIWEGNRKNSSITQLSDTLTK